MYVLPDSHHIHVLELAVDQFTDEMGIQAFYALCGGHRRSHRKLMILQEMEIV